MSKIGRSKLGFLVFLTPKWQSTNNVMLGFASQISIKYFSAAKSFVINRFPHWFFGVPHRFHLQYPWRSSATPAGAPVAWLEWTARSYEKVTFFLDNEAFAVHSWLQTVNCWRSSVLMNFEEHIFRKPSSLRRVRGSSSLRSSLGRWTRTQSFSEKIFGKNL